MIGGGAAQLGRDRMNRRQKQAEETERLAPQVELEAHQALARGDHNAVIDILHRGYRRDLLSYCWTMLQDKAQGDDAYQDTIITAFRDLDLFNIEEPFRPWLFGIARHRCFRAFRANARRERWRVHGEPPLEVREFRHSGEEALSNEWFEAEVRHCLNMIPERNREALVLRYQVGLSYVDMSCLLGVHPATLQARAMRARDVLEAYLKRRGIDV